MQVHIDTEHPQAVVTDVADLQRLEVLAPQGMPEAELADRLGPLGRPDGDHVWLDVAGLRATGDAGDPAWGAGFDGMIGYAGSKGWLDEAGTAVRAHVVRT